MASNNERTPRTSSKAGAARSPQDTAPASASATTRASASLVVAEGETIRAGGRTYKAGDKITAMDLASARDADGSRAFKRLQDENRITKASRSASSDTDETAVLGAGDAVEAARAKGPSGIEDRIPGVVDDATGAGPSAAQVTAAENGDEGSKAVVDAGLGGTNADFTRAADPEGEGKAE
jgi:hypothetical protein